MMNLLGRYFRSKSDGTVWCVAKEGDESVMIEPASPYARETPICMYINVLMERYEEVRIPWEVVKLGLKKF